jgi:hypothetical protein
VALSGESIKCAGEKFLLILENKNTLSTSFIQRWCERYQIKSYAIAGESSSADVESFEHWKAEILPKILQKFHPQDIYNLDETGVLKFKVYVQIVSMCVYVKQKVFFGR